MESPDEFKEIFSEFYVSFFLILCLNLFDFVMILYVLSNDIYLPRHQKTNLSVQKQLSH